MRVGTKSVLFGVHQFLIHPAIVALGWLRAYGFAPVAVGVRYRWYSVPLHGGGELTRQRAHTVRTCLFDPRLWVAFVVHDIGLLGKPNLDGPEGEAHPEVGAAIMRWLFGEPWGEFVLLHSRYYAKRLGKEPSALCHADKWAIVVEPSWLYLPRAWATGELAEYLANAKQRAEQWTANDPLSQEERAGLASGRPLRWHRALKSYMRRWIAFNPYGSRDLWTRNRHAEVANG